VQNNNEFHREGRDDVEEEINVQRRGMFHLNTCCSRNGPTATASLGDGALVRFQLLQHKRNDGLTTNYMKQSPSSETASHSTTQEIPIPSWNPKVHYRPHYLS
jgi:hypothetical protein